MILLGAMALGALIGAVAGVAVYGVKTALSETKSWSWKAAAAHAAGGVIGGGLFPAILAGLAAVGLPVVAAYVLAGGLSWGGIWSLGQDAASWGLGLQEGLRSPGRYLTATGIGLVATATLMPFAARAIGNSGLVRHSGSVESYVTPSVEHVPASIAKSEAEFLAFGAMAEVADSGINRGALEVVDAIAERNRAKRESSPSRTTPLQPLAPALDPAPQGSFGAFLARQEIAPPLRPLPQRAGIQQELLGLSAR